VGSGVPFKHLEAHRVPSNGLLIFSKLASREDSYIIDTSSHDQLPQSLFIPTYLYLLILPPSSMHLTLPLSQHKADHYHLQWLTIHSVFYPPTPL